MKNKKITPKKQGNVKKPHKKNAEIVLSKTESPQGESQADAVVRRRFGISAAAAKIFNEILRDYPTQIMPALDSGVLAIYAQACCDYKALNEDPGMSDLLQRSKSSEYVQANPVYYLRAKVEQRILACASKLGLSPADRKKLSKGNALPPSESLTGRNPAKLKEKIDDAEEEFA